MSNVVVLGMETRLDIPVSRVLEQAQDQLEGGLVIGWDNDGLLYFASSYADSGEILWLLEKAKALLLNNT